MQARFACEIAHTAEQKLHLATESPSSFAKGTLEEINAFTRVTYEKRRRSRTGDSETEAKTQVREARGAASIKAPGLVEPLNVPEFSHLRGKSQEFTLLPSYPRTNDCHHPQWFFLSPANAFLLLFFSLSSTDYELRFNISHDDLEDHTRMSKKDTNNFEIDKKHRQGLLSGSMMKRGVFEGKVKNNNVNEISKWLSHISLNRQI